MNSCARFIGNRRRNKTGQKNDKITEKHWVMHSSLLFFSSDWVYAKNSTPELLVNTTQSVSIVSSLPLRPARSTWFLIAFKKATTPVPASSGRPKPRTRPPSKPVARAWSRVRTAEWNCGDSMIRCKASADGGTGRSGGKWGNMARSKSGDEKMGARLAGVSTSARDRSMNRILFRIGEWLVNNFSSLPGAWGATEPVPPSEPILRSRFRIWATCSGVGLICCDAGALDDEFHMGSFHDSM